MPGVMIPAADTRANLLESALNLFAAYGYDGVGVQQICDAAGVTKPTLYHYFGSKRGVLETLMDARLSALHAALAKAAAPTDDLPPRWLKSPARRLVSPVKSRRSIGSTSRCGSPPSRARPTGSGRRATSGTSR